MTIWQQMQNEMGKEVPCSGELWDFIKSSDLVDFAGTAISSGTAAIGTEKNGVLVLAGAATTDDSGNNVLLDNAVIGLELGKAVWFGCRFKLSDVTQSDFIIGLVSDDTSLNAGVNHGIYLRKVDGAATFECVSERSTVETSTGQLTGRELVADTWYRFSFVVDQTSDAAGKVHFFLNGVYVGTVEPTNLPVLSDTKLKIGFELLSGDASGTKEARVDWLAFGQER